MLRHAMGPATRYRSSPRDVLRQGGLPGEITIARGNEVRVVDRKLPSCAGHWELSSGLFSVARSSAVDDGARKRELEIHVRTSFCVSSLSVGSIRAIYNANLLRELREISERSAMLPLISSSSLINVYLQRAITPGNN